MSRRIGPEVHAVADDVGEDLARLRGLQGQIETDSGLDALVAENTPHEFVLAGTVFEDQSAGRMSELMHGHAKASGFLNPVDDLGAERYLFLVLAGHAGEQPVRVAAAHQRGPEVVHIFIEERRYRLVELELKRFSVLGVVLGEREPIVGIRPSRLNQVLAEADAGEIAQPDWRHRQDRHRDGDLSQDRGPDRRMRQLATGLSHQLLRQVHDPRPHAVRQNASDQSEILWGHSVFAVLFECEPEVFEPPEGVFIKATDRVREGNKPAAEVDGICRGNLPILAPVAVEDFLGDIWIDQGAQRGQVGERDAHLHRHPDGGDELAPPCRDCRWFARPDALSGLVAADQLEASQIPFDVAAKAPREVVPPGTFGGLHRRLDETQLWPIVDIADAGIPEPRQNSPACGIAGTARRARTVIHVAIDDRLIDRRGLNLNARAEPHQRHQSVARARVR
jgi:hypothetical protein